MNYTQKQEGLIMIRILLTEEEKRKLGNIRRRTSDYRSQRVINALILLSGDAGNISLSIQNAKI
jgi:hypothetical protein